MPQGPALHGGHQHTVPKRMLAEDLVPLTNAAYMQACSRARALAHERRGVGEKHRGG
jgi:hypothetical protein